MSEQYVSEGDLRVRQMREALEAAAEFVVDPDEPTTHPLVMLDTTAHLHREIERVRRLKRAARLVREALMTTTEGGV